MGIMTPNNNPVLQARPLQIKNQRYEGKSRNASNLLSARNNKDSSLSPRANLTMNNIELKMPMSNDKVIRAVPRAFNSSHVSKMRG